MNAHSKQSGVALITALIFTALVTTFAVSIAAQQQIDIRRTGNILSSDRGYVLALGVEDWARDVLKKDIVNATGPVVDHLGEDWNVSLPAIQLEGATISGKLTDLQGRINVNALVDANGAPVPAEIDRFKRLLDLLGLNEDLSDALVDWIDSNTQATIPFGAEDSYYLSLDPSYRTANAPMVSISELRLVQGFEQEVYETISPFLTALPLSGVTAPANNGSGANSNNQQSGNNQGTGNQNVPNPAANSGVSAININTAPAEVLRVLTNPPLSESDAETLIADRGDEGYETQTDFLDHPLIAGGNLTQGNAGTNGLSVTSEYFLIEGDAVLPDARTKLFSVVRRDNGSGNLTVLMRGQGSY